MAEALRARVSGQDDGEVAGAVPMPDRPSAAAVAPAINLLEDDDKPRRPGRKPGSPKVPGSGIKKGTKKTWTQDYKDLIARRGRPFELLADVCRGVKIRVGPQAGPGEPSFVYPSLSERIDAAKILALKLLPDLASQTVGGIPGGEPIRTEDGTPTDSAELARRIAGLLHQTHRKLTEAGSDDGGASPSGAPASVFLASEGGRGPLSAGAPEGPRPGPQAHPAENFSKNSAQGPLAVDEVLALPSGSRARCVEVSDNPLCGIWAFERPNGAGWFEVRRYSSLSRAAARDVASAMCAEGRL